MAGISQTAVVRMRRAFGLHPESRQNLQALERWLFVEKVRDIVHVHLVRR